MQGTERDRQGRGTPTSAPGSHSRGTTRTRRPEEAQNGEEHAQAGSQGSVKVSWAGPRHAGGRRPSSQPRGIRGSERGMRRGRKSKCGASRVGGLSARALRGDGAGLPSNHETRAVRVRSRGKGWPKGSDAKQEAGEPDGLLAPSALGAQHSRGRPGLLLLGSRLPGAPDQKEATIPPKESWGPPT